MDNSIIFQLPTELQYIIDTYNVEHHKNMKLLLSELLLSELLLKILEFKTRCIGCDDIVTESNIIYNTVLFCDYEYCSAWCAIDHEFSLRKAPDARINFRN